MTYQETIDYLYNQRPAFERQGAHGYKPGLQTALDLDEWLGHPHQSYKTIHVAGTNGKGSVSHMLAAVLQQSGYRVGLFTSPHFVDYRERIKVNGQMIPQDYVVEFIEKFKKWNYAGNPSFFEMTSAMAFQYFADENVDVAIIEVGLGGRLDSTNIITPILSIITNISLDHTEFLGETPEEIATEKAGIIKPRIPVVVGEANKGVRMVFENIAAENDSPITFVQDLEEILDSYHTDGHLALTTRNHGIVACELEGDYQVNNVATVIAAFDTLKKCTDFSLADDVLASALPQVATMTGLMGRWMRLGDHPIIIADSAHNIAGITQAMRQLDKYHYCTLRMVVGFMADKDLNHILPLLPKNAVYYFTQASTPRALKSVDLQLMAQEIGLHGRNFNNVFSAVQAAKVDAQSDDFIYVGGSMYVLAELFASVKMSNS